MARASSHLSRRTPHRSAPHIRRGSTGSPAGGRRPSTRWPLPSSRRERAFSSNPGRSHRAPAQSQSASRREAWAGAGATAAEGSGSAAAARAVATEAEAARADIVVLATAGAARLAATVEGNERDILPCNSSAKALQAGAFGGIWPCISTR
eukprot:scaffold9299_cov54-Phaeocystis_antarctica.AAC.3